jgi:DNA-directed RNA polymerase subunit RPC12/RpoP
MVRRIDIYGPQMYYVCSECERRFCGAGVDSTKLRLGQSHRIDFYQ